jgi:hypothetical protein
MTLDPRMIEIQRSSCPQENLKGGPHHPTDQPTDLAISADAQLVKSNPSRAINKIETKGKSRKSELARKTKSLQRFANKIEAQESQFDVMSFCERAARQRTSREKQSRKAVEKAGGSCFLCKIRKTKVKCICFTFLWSWLTLLGV